MSAPNIVNARHVDLDCSARDVTHASYQVTSWTDGLVGIGHTYSGMSAYLPHMSVGEALQLAKAIEDAALEAERTLAEREPAPTGPSCVAALEMPAAQEVAS